MNVISEKQTGNAATLSSMVGKYLTFILAGESYAIPVLKVREIIRLTSITPLPQMPEFIRGVLNLRGKIIPVIDLRRRLGLPESADTQSNCIIVVQVPTASTGTVPIGLVVDAVEEVTQLTAGDLEQTPNFGSRIATDCLLAMAKIKGTVKSLLDIDRVFGNESILGESF
jgi:purine-binding chemotaxis protein CheW